MVGELTPNQAFRRAVEIAGGQSALSRRIGKSQQAISDRLRAGDPLWPEHVLVVEEVTGISRHRLRPDVYGPEPAEGAAA